MLRAVFVLSACLLALSSAPLSLAQQFEFCYKIQGGAGSNTGGFAVWTHGYMWTTGTSGTVSITNTQATRTVINAVGQRHVEQLSGIVAANTRVDTNLYVSGASGYVDGDGIQLPINGTEDFNNGIGTLLGYNLPQPATIVSAYGQTSQLNANINLLYNNAQYGERLDAGGSSIYGTTSSFALQPYNPSQPITSCSITVYQPLCVNYPSTAPDGSVLFNLTLNVPWSQLPATYLGDVFTALTVMLAPGNSQVQYLGYFLFSCYPLLSKTSSSQPQVLFYLNSASVSAMGLTMATVVPMIQNALQPSATTLNTQYLPTGERGLVAVAGCPLRISSGQFVPYGNGVTGCAASGSSGPTTTGGNTGASSNSGSSGLSHGAIAGIVVGSVVGALLLCTVAFFLLRTVTSGSSSKSTSNTMPAGANHKQFNDEPSTTGSTTDGVELA